MASSVKARRAEPRALRRAAPAALGAAALLLALMGACGSEMAPLEAPASTQGPIHWMLQSSEGERFDLAAYRGRPTLLFVFATWDGASQAALRPLGRFVRHHPEVAVLGLAAQPDAETLATLWAEALSPPFLVAIDPEEELTAGTSPLGRLEAIPAYVMLNASGVEADRQIGFASLGRLERMLDAAE